MAATDDTKGQAMVKMLICISQRPTLTPGELRRLLGLSKDQYHRYLNALALVVPIDYLRKEKRFEIFSSPRIPNIIDNPNEFYSFLLILQTLALNRDPDTARSLAGLRKLLGVGPEIGELLKYCTGVERLPSEPAYRENLLTVFKAIFFKRKMKLVYQADGKKPYRLTVEPYRVVYDKDWYLRALNVDLNEMRTYKIVRIESAAILDEPFTMPEDVEVTVLSSNWDFGSARAKPVKILFSPEMKRYLEEQRFHPTQEIVDLPSGEVELTVKVRVPRNMAHWVLYHGEFARVLEPPELIDAIRSLTVTIRQTYGF